MDSTTWWRRNRLWLALLLPLLGLALAASSFRLFTLYLPWQWSRPIVTNGPTGTLTQDFLATDGAPLSRTVTVTLDAMRAVPSHDEDAAAPGATLWQVDLTLAAAPDQVLDGCQVELLGPDGTRYATTSAGKVPADPDDRFWMGTDHLMCVPEDAPGPTMSFLGVVQPKEGTPERPASWPMTASAAIPDGVRPTAVRVMWNRPTYVELAAPAS